MLIRLVSRAIRFGAAVDDDVRRFGFRPGGHLLRFLLRGGGDLLRRLLGLSEDRGPLFLDLLERMSDRGLWRAGGFELRDQPIDPNDVGIDGPAVVAANRHREGDSADLGRNALALIQASALLRRARFGIEDSGHSPILGGFAGSELIRPWRAAMGRTSPAAARLSRPQPPLWSTRRAPRCQRRAVPLSRSWIARGRAFVSAGAAPGARLGEPGWRGCGRGGGDHLAVREPLPTEPSTGLSSAIGWAATSS